MTASTPRWRFGLSSTMHGLYVIRYLLFSGGAAIAGGLFERALTQRERPLFGLGVGLAVGLVVFRGQLRALRWPQLFLGKDALHLVQRRRVVVLPWTSIKKAEAVGRLVTLELAEPMVAPDGLPAEAIQLEARKLGTSAEELGGRLNALLGSREARAELPADAGIQAHLTPPPPDGR